MSNYEGNAVQSTGEPLSPVAIITGGVAAIISLATAFGLDLTVEQIGAIAAFVSFFAPVVVWLVGRNKVSPTKNIVAFINKNGATVAGEASRETTGDLVRVTAV